MNRLLLALILLASLGLASANAAAIAEGKKLVESGIACDKLTDSQLEEIGEYLMESMHPGASHEAMHKMMGLEEGSPEEELFHTNLAKSMYCNANEPASVPGTGSMMRGMMMSGMMQSMMGGTPAPYAYGMMGYSNLGSFSPNVFNALALVLLVGLIILVYSHVWDRLRQAKKRRGQ